MSQTNFKLLPIEQHLARYQQRITQWLATPDYVPSTEEVSQLRKDLCMLMKQEIQVRNTDQSITVSLATLDTATAAQLPSALWQRLQQLRHELLTFDDELATFNQRLEALCTPHEIQRPH